MRGAWGRIFIEPFDQFKWWLLWKMEPWYEERASLDLEWRTFAQKHNAAGRRPICMYKGMENDLDPEEKANMYEFPKGDPGAPPNCLSDALVKAEEERDSSMLNYVPGKVPN